MSNLFTCPECGDRRASLVTKRDPVSGEEWDVCLSCRSIIEYRPGYLEPTGTNEEGFEN